MYAPLLEVGLSIDWSLGSMKLKRAQLKSPVPLDVYSSDDPKQLRFDNPNRLASGLLANIEEKIRCIDGPKITHSVTNILCKISDHPIQGKNNHVSPTCTCLAHRDTICIYDTCVI
eukprot:TRINITY_DN10067_c1_g1_i1.p1 TRINITY_DN10067_c1_g1~~TRINITY_DN10067_c1_g1_i1.p1  ORF type:complete len:116 (-),score=11.16 TRINITY_DN10067_c1_g1_i1:201-548(-)